MRYIGKQAIYNYTMSALCLFALLLSPMGVTASAEDDAAPKLAITLYIISSFGGEVVVRSEVDGAVKFSKPTVDIPSETIRWFDKGGAYHIHVLNSGESIHMEFKPEKTEEDSGSYGYEVQSLRFMGP